VKHKQNESSNGVLVVVVVVAVEDHCDAGYSHYNSHSHFLKGRGVSTKE